MIQRFKCTFELSWKSLKRYFEVNNNSSEDNVKNVLREAGRQGLIDSVEDWFAFQYARNLTSHTHSERAADQVYAQAVLFAAQTRILVGRLEVLVG